MSTKKKIKQDPEGSNLHRAAKPRHGGNIQAERIEWYTAKAAGVDPGPYDIRAEGNPPSDFEPEEPDRGKPFSGPGRDRDPDDVG